MQQFRCWWQGPAGSDVTKTKFTLGVMGVEGVALVKGERCEASAFSVAVSLTHVAADAL
jgi:hypothetical protein